MNTLTTWAPPVAVSLLLHAVLIVLITYQLSVTHADKSTTQPITVVLLGPAPTIENKPALKRATPAPQPEPLQLPVKTAAPTTVVPVTEISQTAPAAPEPVHTETPVMSPAGGVTQPQQSLNIQPLSKLTSPPAFLHKIDPVYPSTERRSGSQANVLAEVTIDNKGDVIDIRIVKSGGVHFDDAVKDALNKSKFVPGYIGKDAVAVRVFVPFRFNLR